MVSAQKGVCLFLISFDKFHVKTKEQCDILCNITFIVTGFDGIVSCVVFI